jgi:hypothetical protein
MAGAVAHERQVSATRIETRVETKAARSTARLVDDQRDDRGSDAMAAPERVNTRSTKNDTTINKSTVRMPDATPHGRAHPHLLPIPSRDRFSSVASSCDLNPDHSL